MAREKKEQKEEDRIVTINFRTTVGERKDLRRLALELDMTLTELIKRAIAEYKERHQLLE